MKTTHEKLITSLLALGLVGVSPVGAESANTFNPQTLAGLVFSDTPNQDLDGDEIQDNGVETDADNDGFFELYDESNIVEQGAGGFDAWGNGIDIDINNDNVIQTGAYQLDIDGDGVIGTALDIEDTDGDGHQDTSNEAALVPFALGEDTDRDGNLDINEQALANTDGDINLDRGEDFDADGRFDIHNELNIVEQNIDEANYHGLGVGVDVDGDGTIETVTYDLDINGDGVIQAGAYSQDLDGDGNVDAGTERDIDQNGVISLNEDFDGDGNFDRGLENIGDNDGRFDIHNEAAIVEQGIVEQNFGGLGVDVDVNGNGVIDAAPIDFDINNDGTIQVGPYAADLDNDGNVDPGNEFDLDGDGRFDIVDEDIDNDGFFDAINEDVDGDGTLDLFAEDVNQNGTLDVAARSYITAVDSLNPQTVQDLEFVVANDVFINGEIVATENYVDAQDNVLRGEFAAADAVLQGQINTNAANIATNTADIATNTRRIASNRKDIESNTRGIAMVAALQTTTVLPGMTQALDLSAAHFEGETGLAINYSRRINDNVQINFGAATTSDGDENVVKAGIGWQW
jgi:hypothetical protein